MARLEPVTGIPELPDPPAGVTLLDDGFASQHQRRARLTDLLEQIEACGSLSEAARRLRFAYRRAWLLVDAMNKGWAQPLVITATGGKKGGGTQITDYGRHVLRTYRDVQLQLEHLLDTTGNPFEPVP